jgi:hypothetical protein
MEDQHRILIQVILVSWRRESWKPLEAEEEEEEGRSMAPTRLPRCVRRAKLLLRLATSPRVPSSGLDSGPLDCITPLAPFFYPHLAPRSPHRSLFYCKFLYPHDHIRCATFCHGKWGPQETLDSNGFAPRRQGCISILQTTCRLISGTRRCDSVLRVVVGFNNI